MPFVRVGACVDRWTAAVLEPALLARFIASSSIRPREADEDEDDQKAQQYEYKYEYQYKHEFEDLEDAVFAAACAEAAWQPQVAALEECCGAGGDRSAYWVNGSCVRDGGGGDDDDDDDGSGGDGHNAGAGRLGGAGR